MRTYFSSGGARAHAARRRRLAAPLLGVAVVGLLLAGAGGTLALPRHATSDGASPEGWYHLTTKGVLPAVRTNPILVYDAHDGYNLLFGGCKARACPTGETWRYAADAWTNLTPALSVAPAPRTAAAAAYDPLLGEVVVFGGSSGTSVLNDTWSFSGGAWSPVSMSGPSPPARSGAALAFDDLTGSLVLFGGTSANGAPLGDTWTFSASGWTNLTAAIGAAPPARTSAGVTYDAADSEVLLFGGTGVCGAYCNDTWTFDGEHWAPLLGPGASGPDGRTQPAVAYDLGRQAVFLYGGSDGTILDDTWSFAHGLWSLVPTNASSTPGTREGAAAAYDGADGYLLFFGGQSSLPLRTGMFVFLDPLGAVVSAQATTLVPGQADTFSAAASGGLGPYNVSWNFGDGSLGSTGPSTGHTFLAAGAFVVTTTVTDALGVTASTAVRVTVAPPALAVSLVAAPSSPRAGQTVSLTATVSGGVAPYSYQWSGDVSGCTGGAGPTLSCFETSGGNYAVSVTVADATGHSATASQSFTVATAPGGIAGAGGTSAGSAAASLPSAFTSAYIAVAIAVAAAVGVMTYRVGRAREAARREALRPLCYAVPAWSETPAEFRPEAPAPSEPATWDRP